MKSLRVYKLSELKENELYLFISRLDTNFSNGRLSMEIIEGKKTYFYHSSFGKKQLPNAQKSSCFISDKELREVMGIEETYEEQNL